MKYIKLFEEVFGGSHFNYNKLEYFKIQKALMSDKLTLRYIPPMYVGPKYRIALSDDESKLDDKKRELLNRYGIDTQTVEKPYKLVGDELVELPKEQGWTTEA
jgi:hypothetical protein